MKSFISVPFDIKFNIYYKVIQTEGFLAYEYNPFRNLRISGNRYLKNDVSGRYLLKSSNQNIEATLDILEVLKYKKNSDTNYTVEFSKPITIYITEENIDTQYVISETQPGDIDNKYNYTTSTLSSPLKKYTPREVFGLNPLNFDNEEVSINNGDGKFIISNYKGELVDFTTKDLNFDLNHPIDIEIQESYDGSVNLILNDDLNTPRLINSRFTPLENGMYKVVDREGNNDTNIYDEDSLNGEVNLYKSINQIPILEFKGVQSGGELKVGNYVFYFKYVDSDGNETDFVSESGIVSVFLGDLDDAKTIKGGLYDTNSHKLIKFLLSNIDTSYNYISIYYTRCTGTENGTEITKAYKIEDKYVVINTICDITIVGLEPVSEISLNDINISYNIIDKAKTQAQVQNRLFLGNIDKVTVPYKELADLSLRICPEIYSEDSIGRVDAEYKMYGTSTNSLNQGGYYNPYNIYYRLGYWEDIYRFGIVYILNDYTLSPVFNIRGGDLRNNSEFEEFEIYKENTFGEKIRSYIEVNEEGFISGDSVVLSNARGVVRLKRSSESSALDEGNNYLPLGIKFKFQSEVIEELKKYTKGFFFVRQKRVPTVYCQGITIGLESFSHLPVLPIEDTIYFTESFIANNNGKSILTSDYPDRVLTTTFATSYASIIPEAELNSEFYSQIFNGSKFVCRESSIQSNKKYFIQGNNERHYYIDGYKDNTTSDISTIKDVSLTYIDDNIQLKTSGTTDFSSRAGEAEVAYKFKYFYKEDTNRTAKNLLRGSWGPYVGTEGIVGNCRIFEVMIPGYNESLMKDYFKSRFSDLSSYYSISDRQAWEYTNDSMICYRGDCYYGSFTHRMCRNFQDPESPTNDTIVDPNTWENNYSGSDTGALDLEKAELINRGDVNAVEIGHWVTFNCASNINFALRCEDETNVSEVALNGHPRTFYPISRFNTSGEYKIPESTLYNSGLNSSTSDKYHFVVPDVPYIKNEFSNRIMYSDIFISDAYKNSYRVFQLNNYKDYNHEYGNITSIVEWFGNLIVVFERGTGLIPVNERIQTAGELNNPVYLNSNNVLPERPILLSKMYGSQWKDSILRTDNFVYGVDTIAKKIWRTNGRTFEVISDFKIQKYLNDNISLSEREREPLVGVRNVKTHYNKFKFDVMFTFYDDVKESNNVGELITSKEWNLCYNEKLQLWTTRYSWIPLMSENISNVYFSSNKEDSKSTSRVASSWKNSKSSYGIVLGSVFEDDKYTNILSKYNLEDPNNSKLRVNYSGVEIPNLINSGITKDIIIGKLHIKLNLDSDKFRIKYSKYSFNNSEDYPDNDDFKLVTYEEGTSDNIKNITTYLVLKSSDSNIRNKYSKGEDIDISSIYYSLNIQAELVRGRNESITDNIGEIGVDVSNRYNDIVYLRTSEEYWENPTYFWRHGVAGIFDNKEKIYPTSWYKERDSKGVPLSYDPFEFEFVVNKNVGYHKVFTNLFIISNNVLPELVSFEVIGDAYDFSNIPDLKEGSYLVQKGEKEENEVDNYIKFIDNKDCNNNNIGSSAIIFYDDRLSEYSLRRIQPIKDMSTCGIIKGNTRYQEDFVNVTLEPFKYQRGSKGNIKLKIEETRPRDKYIKIRVKYSGDKRVIITALQTMFEISFC